MKQPGDFKVPPLAENEVHIWSFPVSPYRRYAEARTGTLSGREREKAARYLKETDRDRCLVTYALLRDILSIYTLRSPSDISILLSPHGKPYMDGDRSPRFNFSHSGNRILFAFSRNCEVGADVEAEKEYRDLNGLINQCCSEEEKHILGSCPGNHSRLTLFYRFWSCKEAYLKGVGTGITVPLNSVDCSGGDRVRGWSIRSFDHWPGYSAALSVKCDNPRILLITPV